MQKDISEFIDSCIICKKSGNLIQNTEHTPIVTNYPNEIWEIDLIGPINTEFDSKKFIAVAIDHYTKWVEAAEIANKDASVVIKKSKKL